MDKISSFVEQLRLRLGSRRYPSGAWVAGAVAVGTAGFAFLEMRSSLPMHLPIKTNEQPLPEPPPRSMHIQRLKHANYKENSFDVLVIGGGATGGGITLDATSRGLRCAMVDRGDFAAGASSRGTKLIYGGVRYLEKAIRQRDQMELNMVVESLQERNIIIRSAPHLTNAIPIMTPIYDTKELTKYWIVAKFFDLIAGSNKLYRSHFMTREETLRQFPMIKKIGLIGAVVYYDAQMNDSRMCVSLALTAATQGAVVANYVEVEQLIKDENGKVCGAKLRDKIANETWDVYAKVVVNATGAFSGGERMIHIYYLDSVLDMDDSKHKPVVAPSAGVHVVLPDYYSPNSTGMIIPQTKDNRIMFLLPWEDMTLAGTTDDPVTPSELPTATEDQVENILDEISNYLGIPVRREDVKACWSGIRPLAVDPSAAHTSHISRHHVIHVSPSNLISVTGGNWTTYRRISQDAVDKIKTIGKFGETHESTTDTDKLIGAHRYDLKLFTTLAQLYSLDTHIAKHLSRSYGDRAIPVANIAMNGYSAPLSPKYPYLEAEVVYAIKHEYACTAVDVLAYRTRLAFLDQQEAVKALPRVLEIMAEHLKWDEARVETEKQSTLAFLDTMIVKYPHHPKATEQQPTSPVTKPTEVATEHETQSISGNPAQAEE